MIRDEFKQIDASDIAVYGFARLMAIVGLLVAAYLLYKTRSVVQPGVLIAISAATTLWVTGRWLPGLLRPIHRSWMMLAVLLGFVMTRVILFIVFALVVTPIGIFMRLLGKDPLKKRPDATLATYWIPKEPAEPPATRFRRLF
ncbi:MAG: SxtJ family membrane protein [Rhodothermales bacterium]